MKTNFIFIILFTLLLSLFIREPANSEEGWSPCGSVYFEGAYLGRANTVAGLVVPKFGFCRPNLGVELYATARTGIDTRTFVEQSDAIYNDNYLFLGAGIDYVRLIPGVRLSLQLGRSFDLNSKIHRGGFDARAGFMTYHEWRHSLTVFRNEIYSEGFYVRRYQNVIGSIQVKSFYPVWNSEKDPYHGIEAGPYLNLMASGDTADFDYNRFLEAQYGARIRYQAPLTLAFHVLGVAGRRPDSADPVKNYSEFRLLLNGYWEF